MVSKKSIEVYEKFLLSDEITKEIRDVCKELHGTLENANPLSVFRPERFFTKKEKQQKFLIRKLLDQQYVDSFQARVNAIWGEVSGRQNDDDSIKTLVTTMFVPLTICYMEGLVEMSFEVIFKCLKDNSNHF